MTGPVASSCAVAVCGEPRVEGGQYCSKHGPSRGESAVEKMRQSASWLQRVAERGTFEGRPVDELSIATPRAAGGDAAIVCPQCQTRGRVHTLRVKAKRGVSGGKLTGAIFTGGISMLGTGLSRKEWITEARCGNCNSTWTF